MKALSTAALLVCSGPGCEEAFVPAAVDAFLGSWEAAAKVAGWRFGKSRPDGTRPALCRLCGEAAERLFDAGCELIVVDDYLRLLRDHKLPIGPTEMQKRNEAEKRWVELNGQSRNGRRAAA